MIDTKLLEALAAVIEEQSFDKAARRLFLTQSAVSQRIRLLEEKIGQMLVIRSVPIKPTLAGMALLRHYRQLSMLEESLFEELSPQENRERLSVKLAVNADSLDTWFQECVRKIIAAERVLLDLLVDDQSVTHSYLRSGEVQGAITSTPASFQGLTTLALGSLDYCCVATPAFQTRHFPHGLTWEHAQSAPVVMFNHKDRLQHDYLHLLFGETLTPPAHVMPSNTSFQGIILCGGAYGMVPRILARPYLEAGNLVDLRPETPLPVPHYYQCWSLQNRVLQDLAEIIVSTAKDKLSWTS